MRSFLCLLLAILGIIALGKPDRAVDGSAGEAPIPAAKTAVEKVIPPLAERHAARDAHLRQRLAEAHAPHCPCGRH